MERKGTTMTNKQIREALGHNGHECRVRITREGKIYRHGSPVVIDRTKDFWAYVGHVSDYREGNPQ